MSWLKREWEAWACWLPHWMVGWYWRGEANRRAKQLRKLGEDPEHLERMRNLPPSGFFRRDGSSVWIQRRFLDRERVRISDDAALWPGEEATVCGYFPWSTDGPAGTFRETPYMAYVWAAKGYEQYAETDLKKLEARR